MFFLGIVSASLHQRRIHHYRHHRVRVNVPSFTDYGIRFRPGSPTTISTIRLSHTSASSSQDSYRHRPLEHTISNSTCKFATIAIALTVPIVWTISFSSIHHILYAISQRHSSKISIALSNPSIPIQISLNTYILVNIGEYTPAC